MEINEDLKMSVTKYMSMRKIFTGSLNSKCLKQDTVTSDSYLNLQFLCFFLLLVTTRLFALDFTLSFYVNLSSSQKLASLEYALLDSTQVECFWEESPSQAKVDTFKTIRTRIVTQLTETQWKSIQDQINTSNLSQLQKTGVKKTKKGQQCGPQKEWVIKHLGIKYRIYLDNCPNISKSTPGQLSGIKIQVQKFIDTFQEIEKACAAP